MNGISPASSLEEVGIYKDVTPKKMDVYILGVRFSMSGVQAV